MYLCTAVTRLAYQHRKILGSEQCIDLEITLRSVTINPGKKLGIDDISGMLKVGKNADLAI